jgi:subtilisin family serine protease
MVDDRALVGAYDIYRNEAVLASFSNYGECVDLYGLGQLVILPSAAGFYGYFSGTSFSSPLAARYASKLVSKAPTTAALRDLLFGMRDENRFLPLSTMPPELAGATLERMAGRMAAPPTPTVPVDRELQPARIRVRAARAAEN